RATVRTPRHSARNAAAVEPRRRRRPPAPRRPAARVPTSPAARARPGRRPRRRRSSAAAQNPMRSPVTRAESPSAPRARAATAAGKEEVLARRIGRNELAVIGMCRTYVSAQYHYAREGHDGKRANVFATRFASDPGTQNGLYWPSVRGQTRSPLGDLVAEAAA